MKVSFIIPIYNEEIHLQEFLTALDQFPFPFPREFIFIDDASLDHSFQILKSFSFKSNAEIKIFQQEKNQGKGSAIRRGVLGATGDILLIQDADFEYDFRDIEKLVQPIIKDWADVVYGSRFQKGGAQVHRTFHYLVNRFLTLLSNILSGLYLTDMETCYKVFRTDVIKNIVLISNRFGFEPEVTAKIARLKIRIFELPIYYFPRNYLEGKKITWKDGIAAIFHIFKYNLFFSPRKTFKPTLPKKYSCSEWQLL